MPTQTKRPKTYTRRFKPAPKTETASPNQAADLFEKGRRIIDGEKPAAAPDRKPFFCGSQDVIADAIAEMITTGGTEENLTLIVRAVIDHDWRRRFDEGVNETSRYNPHYCEQETRRILDELAVARQKRTKLELGERPEPTDVVARIRESVREECARSLQELLDCASPEEHRLLNSIVCTYTSFYNGIEGYGTMGLATSFQEEIHNSYEYLRVPARLKNDIETYMDALILACPNGKPREVKA